MSSPWSCSQLQRCREFKSRNRVCRSGAQMCQAAPAPHLRLTFKLSYRKPERPEAERWTLNVWSLKEYLNPCYGEPAHRRLQKVIRMGNQGQTINFICQKKNWAHPWACHEQVEYQRTLSSCNIYVYNSWQASTEETWCICDRFPKIEFRWTCDCRGTSRWCARSRRKCLYLNKWCGFFDCVLGIFTTCCNITHLGTGDIFCLSTFNSSHYIK